MKNCSSDLRAFEQAWTEADIDGSDDLRGNELNKFLGFTHDTSVRNRLHQQTSIDTDSGTGERNEWVTPQGKIMNLVGLGDGDSSALVKSLDDGQPEDTPELSLQDDGLFADDGSLNHFFYSYMCTSPRAGIYGRWTVGTPATHTSNARYSTPKKRRRNL